MASLMRIPFMQSKAANPGTTESAAMASAADWPIAVSRPGLAIAEKFVLRFFPSLSDFAFLAPIVMLFAVMSGTRNMLGDSDTGWRDTGE